MSKFQKILLQGEFKLLLFLAYIASLSWVLLTRHNLLSIISVHFLFVLLFSVFYFGKEFFWVFIAPATAFNVTLEDWRIRRYLKDFDQNIPAEVVE